MTNEIALSLTMSRDKIKRGTNFIGQLEKIEAIEKMTKKQKQICP